MRRLVVLGLLVLPGFLLATPAAEAAAVLWDYDVRVADPASGLVALTLTLSEAKGVLKNVTFLTDEHTYRVTNVSSPTSTASKFSRVSGGWTIEVDEDIERIRFTVDVRRKVDGTSEYETWLGESFGVFRAESFAFPYSYLYYGSTPTWTSRVVFDLPAGWDVEAPWTKDGASSFRLGANETLPRGYIAMGDFHAQNSSFVRGREFRFVRLGNATTEYEKDARALFQLLDKMTPYFETVYGDAAGRVVLAISAPGPMYHRSLAGPDSFYLREGSDEHTIAHEYAHVWQLFGPETQSGNSAIWLVEGDAEYHGTLALFAVDLWSLEKVNDYIRRGLDHKDDPFFPDRALWREGRVVDATRGSKLEQLGYEKGMLILHALDKLIQTRNSTAGLPDLLQALNRAHDTRVRDDDLKSRLASVTNDEILRATNRIAGADLSSFFAAYVHDSEWPEFEPATARGAVVLTNLTLFPTEAKEGDPVTASVTLVNRGFEETEKRVALTVDGAERGTTTVRVPKGETRVANFTFEAPGPGPHEVRALYLAQTLTVLMPARLILHHMTLTPATPVAGDLFQASVFVQNVGEDAGSATIEVALDNRSAAPSQTVDVRGGETKALVFDLVATSPGAHAFRARIQGASGDRVSETQAIVFLEPERVIQENPIGQTPTPGVGLVAFLGLIAVLTFSTRRR